MNNQVVWAPVAKSSFQERTRGILGSIPRENNASPVRMFLCMSRISRLFWMGRKSVRKQKKINDQMNIINLKLWKNNCDHNIT
jgi:hypothetical protein